MENLCQQVSVTNSVYLTAKITLLLDRGSSEFNFFMSDVIRYGGTKFCTER